MKPALIFALAIASTATSLTALAQTYQWKDNSGRTVISDTPPPASVRGAKALGTSPPPSIGETKPAGDAANAAADAPKTTAEKEMEFRKRQQEAREKADKDAKEAANADAKRDNCERARKQLALLESGQRIATTDEKGERRMMEDAEREQEIARAQKFVSESCK